MDDNVIDASERFRRSPAKPSIEELGNFAIEEIGSYWEKFASNNRLNDYFLQQTPLWSQSSINYLEDVTALGILEQKIGLDPQVIAPGFGTDQLGWVAAFRLKGIVIATPFMLSEAYARCFNILLFLKLKRDITTHKL